MFAKDDNENGRKENGFASLLLDTRTVLINGEIDNELAERVMAQLLVLDAKSNDPIKVIITSEGGHVDSGYAIHDMMRLIKSRVIAIGAGWVASIAVPILFGAEKKDRYALPNTRFLLHQPSGGAGGQVADIRIEAQEIIKIRKKINELVAKETGQPVEKVTSDSDRNFWMNAEEAKDYGLVTKIISKMEEIKTS